MVEQGLAGSATSELVGDTTTIENVLNTASAKILELEASPRSELRGDTTIERVIDERSQGK